MIEKYDQQKYNLERKIKFSLVFLYVEKILQALWLPLFLLLLYISVAIFGFFETLSPNLHLFFNFFAFISIGYICKKNISNIKKPSTEDGKKRLDETGGVSHYPIATFEDKLFSGKATTNFTKKLWKKHQQKNRDKLNKIKLKLPRPNLVLHDKYTFRYFVLLIFTVCIFYSNSGNFSKVSHAFFPNAINFFEKTDCSVWIVPPKYTNKNSKLFECGQKIPSKIRLYENSTISAYIKNSVSLFGFFPKLKISNQKYKLKKIDEKSFEIKNIKINQKENTKIKLGFFLNSLIKLKADIIKNKKPTIAFIKEPNTSDNGKIKFFFFLKDDYRPKKVWAKITKKDELNKSIKIDIPKDIYKIDEATKEEHNYFISDLSENIWAGKQAQIQLFAKDDEEKIGKSKKHSIVMPKKIFFNKIAKKIVKKRQELNDFPEKTEKIAKDISDIAQNWTAYKGKKVTFLSLNVAEKRLKNLFLDDSLKDVSKLLWDSAVGLEDGNLSITKKRLEQAQKELNEIMANKNALPHEINRKINALKTALKQHLQELFKNATPDEDNPYKMVVADSDINAKLLDKALEKIKALISMGAKEKAQELLSKLSKMIQATKEARVLNIPKKQVEKADKLTKRIQNLVKNQEIIKEKTFRIKNNKKLSNEQKNKQIKQLENLEYQMQKSAEALQEEIKKEFGIKLPNMKKAIEKMALAKNALKNKELEKSIEIQSEIIELLRKSTKKAIEKMLQKIVQSIAPGVMIRPYSKSSLQDPLGRDLGLEEILDIELPKDANQNKAREILQEIRTKSNKIDNSYKEKQYIKRLLEEFE